MGETRVYLDGLIREFEAEGFSVGLWVRRDGYTMELPFRSAPMGEFFSKFSDPDANQARIDAHAVWDRHVAYMNREATR
jgi:hypothetical protein